MDKNFEKNASAQNNTAAAGNTKNPTRAQSEKKHRNVEPCKIDHTNDTIIITKDFAKKANNPLNAEFKYLASLRQSFPGYKVVARAAKSSSSRPSMKGLSDKFMKHHILVLHQNDIAEYERQKEISEAFKCPHMYMRKWFEKKYPNWREYAIRDAA